MSINGIANDQMNTAKDISQHYGSLIIIRRWIGAGIDLAVCALLIFFPHLLGYEIPYDREFLMWIPILAYFLIGECRWGRTVGKLVTGTVVVDGHGEFPRLGQVVIRTLFRVLEVNPILAGGIPAGLIAAMSKYKQRMGDKAAQTFVVVARDLREMNIAESKAAVVPREPK